MQAAARKTRKKTFGAYDYAGGRNFEETETSFRGKYCAILRGVAGRSCSSGPVRT